MEHFRLIRELNSDLITESYLDEAKNKRWTIKGITLQAEIVNANKRKYPANVIEEAIKLHCDKNLSEGRCLGELNHPPENAASIDLKNVSHKFTSVFKEGNNFLTTAEVLDTPNGKIVQNLLEAGVKLGISSRALGSIKTGKEFTLVEKMKLVTLGDIVSDPSAPDAFLQGLWEQKEWIYENGVFVEKDLSEPIDKYHKILKESKKHDIQKAIKYIMTDYFKNLHT